MTATILRPIHLTTLTVTVGRGVKHPGRTLLQSPHGTTKTNATGSLHRSLILRDWGTGNCHIADTRPPKYQYSEQVPFRSATSPNAQQPISQKFAGTQLHCSGKSIGAAGYNSFVISVVLQRPAAVIRVSSLAQPVPNGELFIVS
jgi:hypothetical protein